VPTTTSSKTSAKGIPLIQGIITVVWPSFLAATAATIVFFSLFDPTDLSSLLGFPELSHLAGYTGGFFAFWLLTSISSSLTNYFRPPGNQVDQQRGLEH